MKAFAINVEPIAGATGASLSVNCSWVPVTMELGRPGCELVGDVDFRGTVSNIGGGYAVTGVFNAEYNAVCDRCLTGFARKVRLPLSRVFAEPNSSIELPGDDEVEHMDGLEIDLESHIREELILSMPIRLLCSEMCKGICPDCGMDLNKSDCICAEKH